MESSTTINKPSSPSDDISITEDVPAFAELARDEPHDALSFYEMEHQILALYDHLMELKLEIALTETSKGLPSMDQPSLDLDPSSELKAVEKECLEARAIYLLRDSIVENVLVTDPILKAVHSGINGTSAERSLHTLIDRRDILSIAHTNISTSLSSIFKASTLTEAENLRVMTQNRVKAITLLDLAKETKLYRSSAIEASDLKNRLKDIQAQTNIAKTRWRTMKNVVAAVVVGSGIDWATNDQLRDLVLDTEDEWSD